MVWPYYHIMSVALALHGMAVRQVATADEVKHKHEGEDGCKRVGFGLGLAVIRERQAMYSIGVASQCEREAKGRDHHVRS